MTTNIVPGTGKHVHRNIAARALEYLHPVEHQVRYHDRVQHFGEQPSGPRHAEQTVQRQDVPREDAHRPDPKRSKCPPTRNAKSRSSLLYRKNRTYEFIFFLFFFPAILNRTFVFRLSNRWCRDF